MGKYNFNLELVRQNALLLILEQVKKNSTILEFGPAEGRLTKFLKERLSCHMYLVELDEEAGKHALQYAEDLVVGDAENYEWLERYWGIQFDYVICADVLEHLRNPGKLIATAKQLLKEDGSMLLSVPNLAHNAVIINLLNNNFEYTQTGLLDDTHIHLFTKNSLENMIRQASMYPVKRFATYAKTSKCEIPASTSGVAGIPAAFWDNRQYGEVYQYVYEIKKQNSLPSDTYSLLADSISGSIFQIYMDGEQTFKEEKSLKQYVRNYNGVNNFEIKFPSPQTSIRLDPMNSNGIVKINQMTAYFNKAERKVSIAGHNADDRMGDTFFFLHRDPQILIKVADTEEKIDEIRLKLEYTALGDTPILKKIISMKHSIQTNFLQKKTTLETQLKQKNDELSSKIRQLREAASEREQYKTQLGEAVSEREQYKAQLGEAASEREQYKAQLEKAASEREQYKAQLGEAASEREQYKTQLEEAASEREQYKAQLEEATSEREQYKTQLEEAASEREQYKAELCEARRNLNEINNTFFWKITAPLRKVSGAVQKSRKSRGTTETRR